MGLQHQITTETLRSPTLHSLPHTLIKYTNRCHGQYRNHHCQRDCRKPSFTPIAPEKKHTIPSGNQDCSRPPTPSVKIRSQRSASEAS